MSDATDAAWSDSTAANRLASVAFGILARQGARVQKNNLHLPQGTEAFYLDEAYVHRQLLRLFEDCCELWAYLPVQTPVYDFHDLYRDLMDRGSDSTTFRLVDRAGDLLLLRSDVTLFLARQMGLLLREADLPVRVHYGDTILRHEDRYHISQNEFFQVGAELIGPTGLAADAEIVLLLLDALDRWGASDIVVHIGHRALLRELNPEGELAPAVASRDWARVRTTLKAKRVPSKRVDSLVALYQFIGTREELDSLMKETEFSTDEVETLTYLSSLADEFAALGYGDRVRIDLSEVGSQVYHSGLVFRAYAPDAAAPIASGGRYDRLLSHFGFDAPSVGFSVMLRRLQSRRSIGNELQTPDVVTLSEGSFRDRLRHAREMRASGKVVSL